MTRGLFITKVYVIFDHPSYVIYLFVTSVISHFGFEGRSLVLILPDTGHCFLSSFVIRVLIVNAVIAAFRLLSLH